MELWQRGRKSDSRYVTDNDTPLLSLGAQATAADPTIQDILLRLSKIESILTVLLGQGYDGSGTEGPSITLPKLLSCVVRLEKAVDSVTYEANVVQTPSSFLIKEPTSFESLLNITTEAEATKAQVDG